MGRREGRPGVPSRAPRTPPCPEYPPLAVSDLSVAGVIGRTGPATRRGRGRFVRLLLTGVGLVIAFWAFGALSHARADVLPSSDSGRLSQVTRPVRTALRTPAAGARVSPARAGVHTLHGLTKARPRGAGLPRMTAGAPLGGTRKHPLLATVRALTTLPHGTGLSRLHDVRRVADLPGTSLRRTTDLPSIRKVHGAVRGAEALTRTRHRYSPRPPAEPGAGAGCAERPTPVAPAQRLDHALATWGSSADPPRYEPVISGPGIPPPRMKPTGAFTRTPPRPARAGTPTPVSPPVSGSGGSDSSGGKSPGGAGDVPHLSLPTGGLWSIAHQTSTMPSRTIADKPSFSPD
jgi:hypothetical protein